MINEVVAEFAVQAGAAIGQPITIVTNGRFDRGKIAEVTLTCWVLPGAEYTRISRTQLQVEFQIRLAAIAPLRLAENNEQPEAAIQLAENIIKELLKQNAFTEIEAILQSVTLPSIAEASAEYELALSDIVADFSFIQRTYTK